MKRVAVKAWMVVLLGIMLTGCGGSPQARSDKFLARGKVYLEKRDYARATLEFSNASKAMPDNAEPYYYAGITALSTGDLQRAYNYFIKTVELNPQHTNARLRIAQLKTKGNPDIVRDAETELTELTAGGSPTPEMLNTLAVTELKLGKTEGAVQALEEALTQSPGELLSSILLAQTRLSQNDVHGAEDVLKKACEAAPKAARPQLILARFYTTFKKDAEAEQAIRRALQLDPKNEVALRDLAYLQNRTGRNKEAEESYKKLTASDRDDFKTLYAFFLFSQGRHDEAVREFERLLKDNPKNRLARTRLVIVYQAVNRPADARRLLDEALKKNPKDLEALLQRGQMLTADGKYSEAEADLNALINLSPDLPAGRYALARVHKAKGLELPYREDLFKVLELNPLLIDVRMELAGELIASQHPKDALALLDQAPDLQKKSLALLAQRNWALWSSGNYQEMRQGIDRGLSQARSLEFLLQDGLWKLHAGNPNGARASLEEALKMDPGDVRALAGLKDAYLMLKQAPMAIQKVKEYASQQPKSASAQEFLGYIMWGSGDPAAARQAFSAAHAADPNRDTAELAVVQLDVVEKRWDDAIGKLKAMAVANPSSTRAPLWLGILEASQGNQAAALEDFRKALNTSPENAQALNNFAYLLSEQAKKPDEALKYAEKAVQTSPNNPEYADTLGWILYRKGLYAPAIGHLERAASTGKSPIAKYHLAMAYAKSGDLKRGRLAFEEAKKQNARLPEAAEASELLTAH